MSLPTDAELNTIGVLRRRLIEARVLAPMLDAMGERFGREEVLAIARDVIIALAEQQGRQLAESVGGCSLPHFERTLDGWKADDALRGREPLQFRLHAHPGAPVRRILHVGRASADVRRSVRVAPRAGLTAVATTSSGWFRCTAS